MAAALQLRVHLRCEVSFMFGKDRQYCVLNHANKNWRKQIITRFAYNICFTLLNRCFGESDFDYSLATLAS